MNNPHLPLDSSSNPTSSPGSARLHRVWAAITLVAFMLGIFSGFTGNELRHKTQDEKAALAKEKHSSEMVLEVTPPEGYTLPASYGMIGPELIAAGAFSYDVFVNVYEQAGKPLSEKELAVLSSGSDEAITIDHQNAYFLLNLFWALGLTNRNPILTEGPMVEQSGGRFEGFASTGGWSIAARPIRELYASSEIVTLTPAQQKRVEKAARQVYRPCCDNPTHFPDCNHGMAMLGLLQLMAAQGASEQQMFEAARYVNAFWYPAQNYQLAAFFQAAMQQNYAEVDPAVVVSKTYSSVSGFQAVYQWLGKNGLLEQNPGGSGGGCGV